MTHSRNARIFWLLVFGAVSLAMAQVPSNRRANDGVAIGVLGLFHARDVVVRPQTETPLVCVADQRRLSVVSPLNIVLQGKGLSIDGEPGNVNSLHCDDGQGHDSSFVVSVPGKISRRYLGKLEVRPNAGQLVTVVRMGLETAVASVVEAESPPGAPIEALKAQAVATRSFFVAGKGRHRGFEFCDTTHCQFLRTPPAASSVATQATLATAGLVLAYQDTPFAALYSSSCGGRTHSLQELGLPLRDYPYFAVTCRYCQRHPEKWVSRIHESDAAGLAPTEHARLQLARKLGWKAVPSNNYSSRSEDGAIVLEGVGVGHGIGLCQRGAADMARDGASFQEILEHYYPNTSLQRLPSLGSTSPRPALR